jgi:hypothetical protein
LCRTKKAPHVIERIEDFGERTRVLLEKYEEYIPSFGHLLLYYKSQEERMAIETEKVEKYGLQSFLEGGYDQAHARGTMLGCIAFAIVFSQLAESQRNILIRHSPYSQMHNIRPGTCRRLAYASHNSN